MTYGLLSVWNFKYFPNSDTTFKSKKRIGFTQITATDFNSTTVSIWLEQTLAFIYMAIRGLTKIADSYSGPSLIRIAWDQISEIFGLVKATAATCVIVTAPYLHSVLGSLGSLPLLHVHRTHNTAPKLSLLLHLTRKT